MKSVDNVPSKRESIPYPLQNFDSASVYREMGNDNMNNAYGSGIKIKPSQRDSEIRASKNYKNSSRNSYMSPINKSREDHGDHEYNAEVTNADKGANLDSNPILSKHSSDQFKFLGDKTNKTSASASNKKQANDNAFSDLVNQQIVDQETQQPRKSQVIFSLFKEAKAEQTKTVNPYAQKLNSVSPF